MRKTPESDSDQYMSSWSERYQQPVSGMESRWFFSKTSKGNKDTAVCIATRFTSSFRHQQRKKILPKNQPKKPSEKTHRKKPYLPLSPWLLKKQRTLLLQHSPLA